MAQNDKDLGRQLSPTEVALRNVQNILASADQDLLFNVRTRFKGLVNAYADDPVGAALLNLLMAEHITKKKLETPIVYTSSEPN